MSERSTSDPASASLPRVTILGGGPAGLGAAWQLALRNKARVTVVEQNPWFGGNAGSFEWDGQRLDFGSHRLHPACEPRILDDLKQLLGPELLDRPRHGRIRLGGRFVHFPLKPVDLLLRLDPTFALGMAKDTLAKPFRGGRGADGGADTFASVLRANLGRTMCERFYFPYARKIWGREPEALSGIQARRRVSAGTVLKLVRKVLNAVPGFKKPGSGRFWYPRRAYGQISEALAQAAANAGATVLTQKRVERLEMPRGAEPWQVRLEGGGEPIAADHVWSTLPVTLLPRMIRTADRSAAGSSTGAALAAAAAVKYRAMLLVYLRLPVEQFTEFDAHYFPEAAITITRLSEPKNYSDAGRPRGATTLCAELPCDADEPLFRADDAVLAKTVADDLARAGLPLPVAPTAVKVMRLPQAYPIYLNGYERPLAELDQWVETLPRFLTYGRQGLFAHDNTHHALAMAYAAVDCLEGADFSRPRWAEHRRVFATHVVED